MADTLDQFAYAPGDMCIGICWKGGGTPAKESKHRDWEVRVLVARVEGDQIVWRAIGAREDGTAVSIPQ